MFENRLLTWTLIAYSDIADVMPRLDKLKAAFGDSADFQQILGLIYSDILEFHQRAYKMFRRRAWHVWFAFDWGLFERRFKSILQRLASHCDLLDKEAAASHYLEMKVMREKRQLEEEYYERQRHNQLARETLGWLSADEDSQEEFLHRLSDQRRDGTCDWILSEQQVSTWIKDDDSDPTVWMTGIPGAGKSFLCSLIVQNSEIHQDRSTIYYFCGQKPSDKDAPTSLLRTLAVQLLKQNMELAPLIHQAFLQKGSGRSAPIIKGVLKEILSTIRASRMVLDGIDEWDQAAQRDTLKTLVKLQKHGGSNCKLLVSSRQVPVIGKAIPHKVHMRIDTRSAEGLNRYITSKIEDLQDRFPDFAPPIWGRVAHNLQNKAKGMFLWVRLVTTMLEDCSSEVEFEQAIEQLPDGLDEAYGRILSRLHILSALLKERALKVLFWVCLAYRSINIHEVVDGIALKPGQTDLSVKNRSQNADRDILELCAPMLEKTEKGTLEVVHFSAKEYLLDIQSGPFIDIAQAHFHIAFSCIVNLTSALILVPSHSESTTETDIERLVVTGSYGLHSYAHQYWVKHLAAYLDGVPDLDNQSMQLMEALKTFSRVRKGYSSRNVEASPLLQWDHNMHAFQKLQEFPALAQLVSIWVHFKARLAELVSTFETLEAQETFLLQNDQTFLSLIDQRLREVTERLLQMDRCALPSHVEETAYNAFVARFGFSCRVHGCDHNFSSAQERDRHELSHTTLFPCLQCDFSGRGFRSRETLRKHTQRYHMAPEDFEVPTSLNSCLDDPNPVSFSGGGSSSTSARISRSWTEQGRKASQQSFQRILATVESKLSASICDASQQGSDDLDHVVTPGIRPPIAINTDLVVLDFDTIRHSIKEQRYNSLSDFKDDIHNLFRNAALSGSSKIQDEVDTICDGELEKVTTGFPAFAKVDSKIPRSVLGFRSPELDIDGIQDHSETGSRYTEVQDLLDQSLSRKRKTYWSLAEEKELPALLDRYGRDLIKIAACLKTKTLEEIDMHLLHHLGSKRGLSPAPNEEAEAQSKSQLVPTQKASESALLPDMMMQSSSQDSRQLAADFVVWPPGYTTQPLARPENTANDRPRGLSTVKHTDNAETSAGDDQAANHPKKARRPRSRAQCHYCHNDFDEYAVKKHIDRFHTATRRIWICKDKSMNRTFFSECKACSADKRYASKHNAMKHLRESHFANSASELTLLRWMEQVEEPNPSYRDPDAHAPKLGLIKGGKSNARTPSTSARAEKRRKTEKVPPIRQIPELMNVSNQLPAIRSISSGAKIANHESTPEPLPEESDADSSDSDLSPSREIELLPDVSFDNLLPLSGSARSGSSDNTIDSLNKSCIRPSQVDRLPHLDKYQKALCLDQVEALHSVLMTQDPSSQRYKKAEKELTSLSRTLLRGLRDWRQHSTLAPTLPFSI